MKTNSRNAGWLVAAGALLFAAAAVAAPSNKWRLELDGHASAAGRIELNLTPKGAKAVTVAVDIPAGTTENVAARLLRDAISTRFGSVYHVEVDDGEDVLVKAKGSTPSFELVVVSNTATGLKIEPEHE